MKWCGHVIEREDNHLVKREEERKRLEKRWRGTCKWHANIVDSDADVCEHGEGQKTSIPMNPR